MRRDAAPLVPVTERKDLKRMSCVFTTSYPSIVQLLLRWGKEPIGQNSQTTWQELLLNGSYCCAILVDQPATPLCCWQEMLISRDLFCFTATALPIINQSLLDRLLPLNQPTIPRSTSYS